MFCISADFRQHEQKKNPPIPALQLIFVSTNRKNPTTYHVSKDRTHALKYQDLRLAFLLLLLDIDQEHVLAVGVIIEHECVSVDIGFVYDLSL